jgi:diaminohydroxyphosphoribosylaminopyrimidine deaminase/5-amino-6-(5-phosphoribosylamino)uracil reductase
MEEQFMRQALELADATVHRTSPNPTVGCVIVAGDRIVGRGVTQPFGQGHAEVMALAEAGEQARGARMYVTLEPCCHVGNTPPCTSAIIKAGIAEVFVGVIDPNPLVHGKGLALLRDAGIRVNDGILAADCSIHHAPFCQFIRSGRPWVTLKGATTLDGQIATTTGDSKWITGQASRIDVHGLRAKVDAVLVGAETARLDNPRLNVRLVQGDDPIRVVLDSKATLQPTAALMGPGTLIFIGPDAPLDRIDGIRATGAEVIGAPLGVGGLDLVSILETLGARGIVHLLVEGGGHIHRSLLDQRLADEACIYIAPKLLGQGRPLLPGAGPDMVSQACTLTNVQIIPFANDVRIRGHIQYPELPSP